MGHAGPTAACCPPSTPATTTCTPHADLAAGEVAGVAFSKNTSSSVDNVGYLIPGSVVSHFLKECDQWGRFRGVPAPGWGSQGMENAHLRDYLQVRAAAGGRLAGLIV